MDKKEVGWAEKKDCVNCDGLGCSFCNYHGWVLVMRRKKKAN